ncbi:hypothetical protein [Nocardia nova]|jgi:hypothetical protein|uniref:hypothetical protein n=1 Tax=Nocardia nova TaxID=37330 RepID=UPI000CEA63CA|nr:hypothetical protein [Nocardia nova]PPI93265.1 hypothetical protein C5E46_25965 [Nocardia nova]
MTDLVSFAKKAGGFAAIGGAGYVLPVGVVVVVLAVLLLAAALVIFIVAPTARAAYASDDAGKRQAALEVLETLLPWSRTGHRNSEKPSGTTEP